MFSKLLKISSFLALTLVTVSLAAQPDSLQKTKYIRSLAKASMSTFYHNDSLFLANTNKWKIETGTSEPLFRIISLWHVFKRNYSTVANAEKQRDMLKIFRNRKHKILQLPNDSSIQLDHLPLGRSFDVFTTQLADSLLPYQIKGTLAHHLCAIYSSEKLRMKLAELNHKKWAIKSTLFFHEQPTDFFQLMRKWKRFNPWSEPQHRIETLWKIANNKLSKDDVNELCFFYLRNFYSREKEAKRRKYKQPTQQSNYILVNGAFDQFTRKTAKQLLKTLPKGTDAEFLANFYSGKINTSKKIYKRRYKNTQLYHNAITQVQQEMQFGIELSIGGGVLHLPNFDQRDWASNISVKLNYAHKQNNYFLSYTEASINHSKYTFQHEGQILSADSIDLIYGHIGYGREFFYNNYFNTIVPYVSIGWAHVTISHNETDNQVTHLFDQGTLAAAIGLELRWRMFTLTAEWQNRSIFPSDIPSEFHSTAFVGLRVDLLGRWFNIMAL